MFKKIYAIKSFLGKVPGKIFNGFDGDKICVNIISMSFEDKGILENLLWAVPLFLFILLFLKFNVYRYLKKFKGDMPGFFKYLKRDLNFLFLFLSLITLFFGFFHLKLGERYSGHLKGGELNIYFLFDVSYSMLSSDIKPSRLEMAKNMAISLLEKFKGEKYGIIIFAGKSFILSPLTSDYETTKFLISKLSPENISSQGSDLNPPLKMLLKMVKGKKDVKKIAILLTDGEFFKKVDYNLLDSLKKEGVEFLLLGIATPEGGTIPDPRSRYLKPIEVKGKIVYSHLHEKELIDISERLNGKYVRFSTIPEANRKISSFIEKSGIKRRYGFKKEKIDGSFLLFFISSFFFLLYLYFGRVEIKKPLFLTFILLFFWGFAFSSVNEFVAKGNRFYKMKKYNEALKEYVEALNGVKKGSENFLKISSNISLTLFQKGDFKRAIYVLENGINSYKRSDFLKGEAYYNLGTMYLLRKEYEYARTFLVNSLKLNPQDMDAKYNLEIVLKMLSKKNKKSKKNENVEKNLNSLREREKTFFDTKPKKKSPGLKGPYW